MKQFSLLHTIFDICIFDINFVYILDLDLMAAHMWFCGLHRLSILSFPHTCRKEAVSYNYN